MKLYQLTERIRELEDLLEDSPLDLSNNKENELVRELLADLDETWIKLEEKVDSIASLIKKYESYIEIRKGEIKRLQDLSKRDEKTITFLKEYVRKSLERANKKTYKTPKFNLAIKTSSTASLVLLEDNPDLFPDEYLKVKKEIDKAKIKEDLIKGELLASKYAYLAEKTNYLTIK